jgi:hypothetical protein
MEIHELLRLLRAGESERSIRHLLGYNRRTIRRYQAWAARPTTCSPGRCQTLRHYRRS